MIILAVWLTTSFTGEQSPQDVEAGSNPPIEIRLGYDEHGTGERLLPYALSETKKVLPSMRRSETRRFVILSDLSDEEVAAHGRLLERAAHAVEDFRKRLGLEAEHQHIQEKMLAVAFRRRADFLWFARRHDRLEASWMAGYFAPNPGRLVYFHARDIPSARVAARELDLLALDDRMITDARESLETFIDQSTAAVVVHEAVHMILHERGIIPANSGIPLWLAEGVAASFEPIEPSRAFGPFQHASGRTRAFREHLFKGTVPPLKVLVGSRALPAGDNDEVRTFYDASASLCGWLAREEPEAFAELIRKATRGQIGDKPESRIELFEELFGSVDAIEARWHARERSRGGI